MAVMPAGIMWKKAPPINEPAAKEINGKSKRSSVSALSIRVRLPTKAMALINRLLLIIQANVVMGISR